MQATFADVASPTVGMQLDILCGLAIDCFNGCTCVMWRGLEGFRVCCVFKSNCKSGNQCSS